MGAPSIGMSLAGISNAEQGGCGRLTGDSNVGLAAATRRRLAKMHLEVDPGDADEAEARGLT